MGDTSGVTQVAIICSYSLSGTWRPIVQRRKDTVECDLEAGHILLSTLFPCATMPWCDGQGCYVDIRGRGGCFEEKRLLLIELLV
jgi:hypothetical protein